MGTWKMVFYRIFARWKYVRTGRISCYIDEMRFVLTLADRLKSGLISTLVFTIFHDMLNLCRSVI